MLIAWTVIISIVLLDVFFESISGKNIFGFGGPLVYGNRIVSFFKDEPIAGSFIYGLIFIIIGCLFILQKKKINYLKKCLKIRKIIE